MLIQRLFLPLIAMLVFSISANAQQNDYAANWKKVDAFEKKGLTKSALTEVESIFNLALKDKNDAQQIKAAIYQIKYRSMTDEDSRLNNFFYVDTLIKKINTSRLPDLPAKNILLSMQAEMLWQYLQNNRWRFYNRTTVAEEKSNDISTWSIDKINTTIAALYKASLTNESILKTTKLNGYDAIIIKGTNTRQLRPTLYDFLAQRAIHFFVSDEIYITKPAYAFTINDAAYFAPAAQFAATNFTTKDTAALCFKAIQLFQNILKFHLKDASPSALIDADLIRLDFVNNHAIMPDKDKLYEAALQQIETTYPNDSTTAQAIYLRANIYYQRGQDYNPLNNTTNQYEIKRAKDLCETIVQKFPKTEGGVNAQNLINQIEQPSLNLETEKVNIPNQPFRSLVSYKNINTIYLRVIKTSRDEIQRLDRTDENKYWSQLLKLKSIKEWSINLPDLKDYQQHSAEIKTDGLDNGIYFIIASKTADFSLSKNIIAKQQVYVSNISYINNGNDYYVLNRDNGLPLQNVQVQVWESKYDYNTYKNSLIKEELYTTDVNGHFKIKINKDSRNVLLQFINGNDELFLEDESDNIGDTYNNDEAEIKPTTFLFTDRSIYRPGQTVYFKGIVVNKDTKKNKSNIIPDFKTTVLLLDNNDQKVASVSVNTNEFGSYHGTFILPQGLLNGSFSIKDSITEDNNDISVEEYKRPKFYVEIEKPKGTYRLNDSITVTGSAKAYAGNSIDGASVKYRVVRRTNYPDWAFSNRFKPYRRNEEMEISNGEITSNEKGEFKITFKAIPDESIDKKQQSVFNYEVSADITDINGETRSDNSSVAVGYQMLQLNIIAPDKIAIDSFKTIIVKSTNLNDIEDNTIVSVNIQKLKSPNRIFRERLWDEPDQFTMSKDEYYNYFPYDIYKDENEVQNFPIELYLYKRTDSTNRQFSLFVHPELMDEDWHPGWYKIVADAKDKYGETVSTTKYIELTTTNDKVHVPIDLSIDKPYIEPGEKATYKIATGFDKLWLITGIHKMDSSNSISYPIIQQNKPLQQTILATETDRGGIAIDYAFVQHNRFYSGSQTINVPWSNKDLNISFKTFRDKLLPGAKETWSIKISGYKNEKLAAEMLTAMYDASLDQFSQQSWHTPDLWDNLGFDESWDGNGFGKSESDEKNGVNFLYKDYQKSYDGLLSYESVGLVRHMRFAVSSIKTVSDKIQFNMNSVKGATAAKLPPPPKIETIKFTPPKIVKDEEISGEEKPVSGDFLYAFSPSNNKDAVRIAFDIPARPIPEVQIRKNFNETAFFYPDLKTDTAGNIEFSFTMPDAVTQWKWMLLAHTKDMASAYTEKTITTQKPLMVQPNAPRFLREGDKMEFSAKIVNLSDSAINGNTELQLLDAVTNQPIDNLFKNNLPSQPFTVAAGQSVAVKFPIDIPLNFNSALTYRIIAKSNNFSDGEEMAIPVLSNRTLVTETMPLNIRNTNKKEFKFEKLLNSGNSSTISNHALTVEFTSNPAWYAVQALPYLMEYPYECAEQTFNRYYANILASYISNSTPKIKEVFTKWRNVDTAALLSNLQKNEELKDALLQETPWVLDAKNENQQKKNIALLFDMVRMSAEQDKALGKLKDMQSSNGGFVWFKGGPDDRYITQYIVTGIGHLKKLNALNKDAAKNIQSIIDNAIPYLDKKIKEDYDYLIRYKSNLKENNLSATQIQYLYMRSFFPEYKIAAASQTAYTYYRNQAKKYWLSNSKYTQAMIALALYRTNDNATPKAIIQSLKENAINKEEMGMYWKEWTNGGYYWYQAPIESQALMIEAFTDIDKNPATIDDLKTWLLNQKQTQNWKTTKATAEACYALLLNGTDWLSEEKNIQLQLGDTVINSNQQEQEAGTGYFKTTIDGNNVKPIMGNITVSIQSNNKGINIPAEDSSKVPPRGGFRGALYWQYFEDLDKITPSETPLKLAKKLFIEKNTDKGPVLIAVTDTTALHIGDKIKVRIELRVDRLMEYVHMKDMRAACMEPVNVLSEYKWQDGLGYYESTKDASTNFFFGSLPKGTYVFEYPMFVTHTGNFSNGITSIQCMYAPEFTAHSEGVRVSVGN